MDNIVVTAQPSAKKNQNKLIKDIITNKYIYIMLIPVFLYYIIFHYAPMFGAIIAFKEYRPGLGIFGSPWVGLRYFKDFFTDMYFMRLIKNTLLISFYEIVFGFPAPIILALMLNEVKKDSFKKTMQTITYLPHFVSLVVICGMVKEFTASNGLINDIVAILGGERATMLLKPEYFKTIFVSTGIWQQLGWGSILYLSAMSGIDSEQYEAARIDGAGRWKQMINVTLPGVYPTIVIMLILRIGSVMSVGFEKVILLYNPSTYSTADVISSYVYRKGLQEFNYSYSSAIGIFNAVINFGLVIGSNWISRKLNDTSLW